MDKINKFQQHKFKTVGFRSPFRGKLPLYQNEALAKCLSVKVWYLQLHTKHLKSSFPFDSFLIFIFTVWVRHCNGFSRISPFRQLALWKNSLIKIKLLIYIHAAVFFTRGGSIIVIIRTGHVGVSRCSKGSRNALPVQVMVTNVRVSSHVKKNIGSFGLKIKRQWHNQPSQFF